MQKIRTTTRYAEDYDNLHIEADVDVNELTGETTSVNNGIVLENGIQKAWFNYNSNQLQIGGIDHEEEALTDIVEAVESFYSEVKN